MRLFKEGDPADLSAGRTETTSALDRAASAIARLDQTLTRHPLLPAFLYRFRLIAIRRMAAVDGDLIEPWHLAAVLEGLRLRMDPSLSLYERGSILHAARTALGLYQWITTPDFDQEGEVQAASMAFRADRPEGSSLLHAARTAHRWLDTGGLRAPLRGALVRYWQQTGRLQAPLPLTGAAALGGDVPFDRARWVPLFLHAIASEAEDGLDLIRDLERAWFTARTAITGRRCNSRASAAVDLLAAAPVISATTLARRLGMATNNAIALLRDFEQIGVAIDVSHRTKRKLYGLAGLERLRDHVAPPRRPQPGRGRGRPRLDPAPTAASAMPDLPPVNPDPVRIRTSFDYTDLEEAMAQADQVIRETRVSLARLSQQDGLVKP